MHFHILSHEGDINHTYSSQPRKSYVTNDRKLGIEILCYDFIIIDLFYCMCLCLSVQQIHTLPTEARKQNRTLETVDGYKLLLVATD